MGVRQVYEAALQARGYKSDPAQLRAIAALERCENEWIDYLAQRSNAVTRLLRRPPIPRGVYMVGGVGRGKSFLMDCFFQSVPLRRKTRLHFHEFMREVHRELQELKGLQNPLDELGKRVARRFRLICFDEFHIADVTDAMILHRMLEALFANRVSIVTTSNFRPEGLYPNGLHRDRILPAIELLKTHLEVINVDAGTDYRRRTLEDMKLYLTPLNDENEAALTRAFESLAEAQDEDRKLMIEHRAIYARRATSVEPVFGIIKRVLGFRQFMLRGERKVSGEWQLVALAYNWWSLFVRLARPDVRHEAITSRPWLMASVGRRTEHAGQTTITLTGLHAHFEKAQAALMRVSALLQGWNAQAAEQLHPATVWQCVCDHLKRALAKSGTHRQAELADPRGAIALGDVAAQEDQGTGLDIGHVGGGRHGHGRQGDVVFFQSVVNAHGVLQKSGDSRPRPPGRRRWGRR